jgi:hypothetical protein
MPRKLMVGVLVVVLVATGASMAVAGGGDDGDDDGGKVIRVVSKTTSDAQLDLGDTGIGVGDRFVFGDELSRNGERIGEDGGECVITHVESETSQTANCVVTLSLPGGQITVQGLVTFTADQAPFTVAVTGGTGRYRDADGEATVETVSDTEDRLIIHLD